MLKKQLAFIVLTIVVIIFSVYSSAIDTYCSKVFYNQVTQRFYGEDHLWCSFIYYSIPVIVALFVIYIIIVLLLPQKFCIKNYLKKKFVLLLAIILIMGPGIFVNIIFKDNWGRPRPYQVLRDQQQFQPFYIPEFGKKENNSFPCGHASIGFFLGVPWLLLNRRKLGFYIASFCGFFIGLVRMLQGGHYFSDVVASFIIVWITAKIIIYASNKFKRLKIYE